jgi:hypothetical protein
MLSSAVVKTCHDAIVEAVAFAEDDWVSHWESPELRSIAWREFCIDAPAESGPSGNWTIETPRAAHAVGTLAVMVSTQTLFGLSQLVRPDQQIAAFAFEIIARSVLEASARAWWIYDPAIEMRPRVARAKTVELYSVDEGVKAERHGLGTIDHFEPERERIIREAKNLGLGFDYSKSGELVGFEGQRRPEATPIIEELLTALGLRDAAKLTYRLYSAVDHATIYATIRSLFTLATTDTTATVSPQVTNEQIANASCVVISAHLGVLSRRAHLYGFDYSKIDAKRFGLCGLILQAATRAGT